MFGGNDLPGVMTASAMRAYANRYGVAAGRKVAVFANGASGYETARDLADKGVEIAAIIDSRVGAADIAPNGARVIAGAQVVDTSGKLRIKGATVERSGYVENHRLRRARHVRRLEPDHPPDVPSRPATGLVGG